MPLSDRHRQLIDQAKATQRSQQLARAQKSPVPNRIGDRDPVTGQHTATYPDGSQTTQGRKLYDAHSSKGDSVTGLPVGDGTIGLLGPKGQASPLAPPAKEGIRGLETQGPLKTNEVGYLRGQVWNYKEPEKEPPTGVVMWLDCNWLLATRRTPNPPIEQGLSFFRALIRHFQTRTIVTLPATDIRLYSEDGSVFSLDDSVVTTFLAEQRLKVGRATIEEARGLFFLPLLHPETRLTTQELLALRRIAKRYGLLICGEWSRWLSYDNHLLRGLGLPSRVSVSRQSSGSNNYQAISSRFPKNSFQGDAQGLFDGLTKQETLVTNQNKEAVFAFFKL